MNRSWLPILFLLLLSANATAIRVGVAPGLQDLGTVERGETKKLTFYVISDVSEPTTVNLKYSPPNMDSLTASDRVNSSQISEESIKDWFNYVEGNQLTVPPEQRFFPGPGLNANLKGSIVVNVPEDAEPGYHAGELLLSPKVDNQAEGLGTQILTTVKMRVLLKVPGDAKRKGEVVQFLAKRVSEDQLMVKTFFHNTGTTTMTVSLDSVTLQKGEETVVSDSGTREKIQPGEIETVFTRFNTRNLEEGEQYNVSATLSSPTGHFSGVGRVTAYPYTETVTRRPQETEPGLTEVLTLWWLPLLIFIIMGVYYYYRRWWS